MTIDVFADLFLSNGERPILSAIVEGPKSSINFGDFKVNFDFRLEIINGIIIVHFTPESDEYKFWEHWDNIFELTKIMIDPIVLTRALHLGQGLLYNINFGRATDGSVVQKIPDIANDPKFDLTSSEQADPIVRLLANNFRFKWAVRDFNMGLIDRKDASFYFYREIEALAKIIGGEDNDGQTKWDDFYNKVSASDEEMAQLKNKTTPETIRYCADKLRHSKAPGQISPQKWEDMKKTAKSILKKSAQYLIKNSTPTTEEI